MNLLHDVLDSLPDGEGVHICIGPHWTAVVIEVEGQRHCGLASTLSGSHVHGVPDVPQAGQLEGLTGRELAALILSEQPTLVSVGTAAVNALLPRQPDTWREINAEEVIAEHGRGKTVALIGHFPFTNRLRPRVGKLHVLELDPQPGDLPVSAASEILPKADVVAITSMTLMNRTLDGLLKLCDPQSLIILLGPTTPLSPVLFDYGIDLLCGSVVTDIQPVLRTVRQAGNFRQVHKAGVRLVSVAQFGADVGAAHIPSV
ncbi:MAG: DUF364 domain-containing protein [Anaerolineales bacterium]|nr:DUF364 domain-containing protein [Chloroflexota bacterium]MBL7162851.1 DUF364 domain-containing protein [Anaerolineales bacterium]